MKYNFIANKQMDATQNEGGNIDIVIKTIKEESASAKAEAKESIERIKGELKTELNQEVEAKINTVAEDVESAKAATQRIEVKLDEMEQKAATRGMGAGEQKEKTFNEYLKDAIEEKATELKNFRKGGRVETTLKAVGDMSYASNFATGSAMTNQVINNVYGQPQENIYLSDILPTMNTTAASVTYPQHTGGEGGAALWSSGSKPLIDFDLAAATAHVKWIAGIVRVPREMLDDLGFLTQFIQTQMLRSLKLAENDFILNGSADTNPVSGLLDVATAYDGAYTNMVDRVVDAAWGQIVEENFNPTHVILQPRDAVAIALNKATGSGEYDLPQGTVGFAGGRLQIAGINTVSTNLMAANNFLAMDRNGAMFVRRMNPELRVFEQNEDDVRKNMVTFRIEERVTLLTPYPKAFVKGLLTPEP